MPNKIGAIIGGAIGGGSAPLLMVTWVQVFDACVITAVAAIVGGIIGYCVSRFMHRYFDRVKRNK